MKNLKNYLRYVKENIDNNFDEDVDDIENFNDDDIDDFEINDDDNNFSEPETDDCIISDVVRGGYDVSCGGKFINNFDDFDDALATVKSWKEENQFFPNTWLISDHGNATLIDDNGNQIN